MSALGTDTETITLRGSLAGGNAQFGHVIRMEAWQPSELERQALEITGQGEAL